MLGGPFLEENSLETGYFVQGSKLVAKLALKPRDLGHLVWPQIRKRIERSRAHLSCTYLSSPLHTRLVPSLRYTLSRGHIA